MSLPLIEYNLIDKSRCLMGNWVEEKGLQEIGVQARVAGKASQNLDTRARVAPGSKGATTKEWQTTARAGMADVSKKVYTEPIGPRERLRNAAIVQEASAFATKILEGKQEPIVISTTTGSTFVSLPQNAYLDRREAIRRPTNQVAAALGMTTIYTAPEQKDLHITSAAVLSNEDVAAYKTRPHYSTDAAITFYTARAVEGIYSKTGVANAASPFSKSLAFTNPIDEGHKHHAGAIDVGSEHNEPSTMGSSIRIGTAPGLITRTGQLKAGTTGLARSAALTGTLTRAPGTLVANGALPGVATSLPGAEIAVMRIFTEFLRRLAETTNGGGRNSAIIRLLGELLPLREAAAAGTIHADDFRNVCNGTFGLYVAGFPTRNLESIIASCDVDGTGRVDFDRFVDNVASSLPATRRAIAHKIFASAAAHDYEHGGGVVASVDRLSAFVAKDAALLESFLAFVVELDLRDAGLSQPEFSAFVAAHSAAIESDADFAKLFAL